jgi:hypothetical protein
MYRKPSKITLAMAGVTAAATVVVASGAALAAPDLVASASKPALSRPGLDASQLGQERAYFASLGASSLALTERRAAERRAAERRAAARRAARRAAARRAAQLAAPPQAGQQPARGAATAGVAPAGTPQQIALAMLGSFGWPASEFGCLQSLWNAESGWNPNASNPSSGAYGIPQALPGSKMASAGSDWQSNPATQIRWGLGYIQQVYGSPCAAWSHEQSSGWY